MLKFKTSCAVLAYLSSNLLNQVGLSLFQYFEVGLRVCYIVVKKFTFAISSPDEFLLPSVGMLFASARAYACVKPHPHQQHCRSNVRLCHKRQQCQTNIRHCRKNRSTYSIRQCCFDIVAGMDGALNTAAVRTQLHASLAYSVH